MKKLLALLSIGLLLFILGCPPQPQAGEPVPGPGVTDEEPADEPPPLDEEPPTDEGITDETVDEGEEPAPDLGTGEKPDDTDE